MRLFGFLRRLVDKRDGATIIEFAMIAPVMILLIMGLGELLYTVYAKSIVDGAVQAAGRGSAIQGGGDRAAEIDAAVLRQVRTMAPSATLTSSRRSYFNFASTKPERFTDSNSNGRRDPGECFDDINNNNRWDADPGAANQGGASDVTRYRAVVTYRRPFPMMGLMGWSPTNTITSETLLKNQPFATQANQVVRSVCT